MMIAGADTASRAPKAHWKDGFDPVITAALLLGWLTIFMPTYLTLAKTIWASDEQGHGPIILAVTLWLLWRLRHDLFALPAQPAPLLGGLMFGFAMLLYVVGKSQNILMFEAGAQIPTLISFLLLFKGRAALRLCWFPLLFMVFMVPLPATFVAWVTTPLKSAVSAVATQVLHLANYPVGRTGVVMTVGNYQLLVADACAGLNSLFTLEALGLLYMQLMNYKSATRNILMAILVVPISFVANITRVIILVLVTYHFGDEAGQGFVHSFAGMVLFMVALALILMVDGVFNLVLRGRKPAANPKTA